MKQERLGTAGQVYEGYDRVGSWDAPPVRDAHPVEVSPSMHHRLDRVASRPRARGDHFLPNAALSIVVD
jgi:hypothetical protein